MINDTGSRINEKNIPNIYRKSNIYRPAFTLIELVTTIFIMGLLIILVLNAVFSARESARKMVCVNNLKQIGVAINGYGSQFGVVPPGHSIGSYSLHVALLPYLENIDIYNSINFKVGGALYPSIVNTTVGQVSLNVFNCPSNRNARDLGLGWSSYAGNRGVAFQLFGYNGVFATAFDPVISYSSVSDGTSNTVSVSEWITSNGSDFDSDALGVVFRTPHEYVDPQQFELFVTACHNANANQYQRSSIMKGNNWLHGEFGRTLYNHTLNINDHSCTNGSAVQHGAWTAGSRHQNGENSLFLDGHVNFLRDKMTLAVWHAIGSRNGNELISGLED